MDDFARRVEHVARFSATTISQYGSLHIWLGGLFSPEALVAATRQAIAASRGWSLETLHLRVTVNDSTAVPDSFTFDGLTLFGAAWRDGALAVSNDVSCPLPSTRFTWVKRDKSMDEVERDETARGEVYASVPVYLDATRQNFLFSIRLRRPNNIPATVWAQRGACITVWAPS